MGKRKGQESEARQRQKDIHQSVGGFSLIPRLSVVWDIMHEDMLAVTKMHGVFGEYQQGHLVSSTVNHLQPLQAEPYH